MKVEYPNKTIFITCILGILLYLAFYPLDLLLYPDSAGSILLIRFCVVSWLVFWLFMFFRLPDDKLWVLAVAYLLPISFGVSLMCFVVGEGFQSPYYVGVLLPIVGAAMFTRIKQSIYVILLGLVLLQHFVLLSFLPVSFRHLMMNVFCLVSAAILSVFIQWCISRYENALLCNQEKLYLVATTDPLTGLLNRRRLIDVMQREKARSARSGRTYVVAIGDIDNFKCINDTCGHEDGDKVLVAAAGILRESLRAQDFVGRWGGEEFLIVMPETDLDGAKLGMDRVRQYIESTPINITDGAHRVTMTFGLASSDQVDDIDEIIRLADEALYEGKYGTKNCVIVRKAENYKGQS